MPAGKDSGARDDPKLLHKDASQNNSYLVQNIVRHTQSEGRKCPFIVDIGAQESHGLTRNRKSAPTTTEPEGTGKATKAATGMAWLPFPWETGIVDIPEESYCWHWLWGGSGPLSPWVMPLESCAGAEVHSAPVPHSRAPLGSCHGVLSKPCIAPSPRRPLPVSWTDLEQCGELAKMGSRAWYVPGAS